MDMETCDRLPLVPEATLKAHKVHVSYDTRFRACARLLQSLRREAAGWKLGGFLEPSGRRRTYGHLLGPTEAAEGANFVSPEIFQLVKRELCYREPGAMIDDSRVFANMLASMPLAFNLFGALSLDRGLAERWVAEVAPDLAGKVSHIQFEHSPGRGDPALTADGTAFDVFISLRLEDGRKAFLAVEVKFSEGMTEPPARLRPRYDELSVASGLYLEPEEPALRKGPLQQLWRQHMLAQAMVMNGLFDAGRVIVVAPALNTEVQRACDRYDRLLAKGSGQVGFEAVALETAISALASAGAPDHARVVADRYINFGPVHELI